MKIHRTCERSLILTASFTKGAEHTDKLITSYARYLARACPRCNGYVGIVIREPTRNVPLQAVNGRCSLCSYRMAWIVIRGKAASSNKIAGNVT